MATPEGWKNVALSEVMTDADIKSLREFVMADRKKRPMGIMHNAVLKWLDEHKDVTKRMYEVGFIKSYFAYCLELYCLSDFE